VNKVNRLQRIPVRTPSSDKTICFFWVPVSSIIRSFPVTGSGQGSSVSKVMVFAGSSRNRFEDFQEACLKDNDEVKAAKAKDFLSRLRGHINVLVPTAAGKSDTLAVIRRALILRDNIQKKARNLLVDNCANIDKKVLDFLLEAKYRHGARSIEAVLDMSRLAGKAAFSWADLPPRDQLNLHVDLGDDLPTGLVSATPSQPQA
jgi:hypothetical protein